MRRLTEAERRLRRRRREKGAVTTIVAIFLAGGVLMGMAALSIDVGSVMYERRQLQNGADATSLALADECARDLSNCDPANPDVRALLNENAPSDNLAQYDKQRPYAPNGACGRGVSPALTDCPTVDSSYQPSLTDLSLCPPLPSWLTGDGATIPYVETYSRTESTEPNNTLLPSYFSQLLVGGSTQASVTSCARAAWGPAGSYTGTVPLTFSACEWEYFMQDYGGYVAEPPGPNGYGGGAGQTPWPDASREKVIYFKADHNSGEPKSCMWNGTSDFPGGFGYLTQDNCQATLTDGDWVDADTGVNMPADCKTEMEKLHDTVVTLPVFNCVQWGATAPTADIQDLDCSQTPNGTKVWYHIAGWAKFYLSGYRYPSGVGDSHYLGAPCDSNEVCISGWFLEGSLGKADTIVPPGGNNDFGTYAVLPAG